MAVKFAYKALPMLVLSNPSQIITVPFCTNPISLFLSSPSSTCSYVRQLIILDIGLNLMIFDKSIHKMEVITDRTTPPHPKSNDQDVVKIRPCNSSNIPLPPIGTTTPSAAPSISVSKRGFCCILLK